MKAVKVGGTRLDVHEVEPGQTAEDALDFTTGPASNFRRAGYDSETRMIRPQSATKHDFRTKIN